MSEEFAIVWEDPGGENSHPAPSIWQRRLAPVMERPGEWARVHEFTINETARSTAHALRTGKLRVPDGKWEFQHRGPRVYARYVGPS